MTFDEYQKLAIRTADLKRKNELFQLVLGLVGESGEIAEKIKKVVRDNNSDESVIDRADMAKELGDVLWYVGVLAEYFELSFDDIAVKNIEKLRSRQERGTLEGSGDNR